MAGPNPYHLTVSSAVIAKFGAFEIPGINSLEERLIDIAQNRRVVGGPERRDSVDVKASWEVRTIPIPLSFVNDFHAYLKSILFGYDEWWIEDFGASENVVIARIDAGTWAKGRVRGLNDRRTLSFTVIER